MSIWRNVVEKNPLRVGRLDRPSDSNNTQWRASQMLFSEHEEEAKRGVEAVTQERQEMFDTYGPSPKWWEQK
jgi:hypothetical protein